MFSIFGIFPSDRKVVPLHFQSEALRFHLRISNQKAELALMSKCPLASLTRQKLKPQKLQSQIDWRGIARYVHTSSAVWWLQHQHLIFRQSVPGNQMQLVHWSFVAHGVIGVYTSRPIHIIIFTFFYERDAPNQIKGKTYARGLPTPVVTASYTLNYELPMETLESLIHFVLGNKHSMNRKEQNTALSIVLQEMHGMFLN